MFVPPNFLNLSPKLIRRELPTDKRLILLRSGKLLNRQARYLSEWNKEVDELWEIQLITQYEVFLAFSWHYLNSYRPSCWAFQTLKFINDVSDLTRRQIHLRHLFCNWNLFEASFRNYFFIQFYWKWLCTHFQQCSINFWNSCLNGWLTLRDD